MRVAGVVYDQWTSAEVTRDLKDFSGSFNFVLRDTKRSLQTFDFASGGALTDIRPGPACEVLINGVVVLKGFIEDVQPDISEKTAGVSISGRDKTGDLVDSAALTDGPSEFRNVKLEEAIKRIAEPFGLGVRSEIDTGEPFTRYSLDLAETAHSAAEKGARSRHALILSDGVGNIVITRTGKKRAPADLRLPGNVIASSGSYSHQGRYSKTYVRGQGEKAGKNRSGSAALDKTAEPLAPGDRQASSGATEIERKGTTATGIAADDEITRYRPVVHLARSKADATAAQDEADWRMRTARGAGEEVTETVKGFDVNGELWRVNEMTYVSDAYQGIERDMLITRVTNRSDQAGDVTELSVTSPEAFDAEPTGKRRTNRTRRKTASGSLDTTAQGL
ncbi:Mu P family protein [Rhizobium leguminosarum bv. trifolii]|uniref:Mu P family protein n=1 Tax=Rhizobium leguminosarum bv. trifolii TaxID=386 RepID=A0A3E1BHI9_RHILT|nr:Mu P family protein [Rhizobium leguminosarum]RFB92050.1 Mu P family protein [Rhizobium leguminosarum bv. trifolii]RFB92546.1 Mu P family protein [Rhizobium leguminosarum bv. trifolii]